MARIQNDVRTAAACSRCGAECADQARFCPDCGLPLVNAATTNVLPDLPLQRQPEGHAATNAPSAGPVTLPAAKRVRPRGRLAALLLIVTALVAGVAILALNDRGTHTRLTATRAALNVSQSQLQGTKTRLAETVTELSGTKTDLATTEATLVTVQRSLAARVQDLQGVRNNLADVKNSVTIQAGQIETLKSCLSGVSLALSDAASSDYSGAVGALQAVQVSCNSAYALL